MAGTLQRRIVQHCTFPGMDFYNTEIIPMNCSEECISSPAINILWCSLSGGVRNHIVPLKKCRGGETGNNEKKIIITYKFIVRIILKFPRVLFKERNL
jgi:hypothetical protein